MENNLPPILPAKPFHLCIEGNIASGKSQLCRTLSESPLIESLQFKILQEPIDEWRSFGLRKFNLLDSLYKEPDKYSWYFQVVAAITKLQQIKDTSGLICTERSFQAQQKVFSPLLLEYGHINNFEYEIIQKLLENLGSLPQFSPDLIVYLRAKPETCLERIKARGRSEEENIALPYLKHLNIKYDNWLLKLCETPVICIDTDNFKNMDISPIFEYLNDLREISQQKKLLSSLIQQGKESLN